MNGAELASRAGTRFGPYQLMQLLGRGGMGEVYQAEDTRKHRVVALKLISPQFSNNSEFRARMQREADTAGRLTEPHIVPIHDYGEIDGQFFVEMRLIAGASLRTMLKHYGPLTPARTVAVVRQIAAALDAAHSNGVTHRDVKPENILIGGDDFAYLVDFGIARAATDPGLTQVGTAVGTYNYMAPERFTGTEVTYRADIYALACVLGECLTGAPPYHADSVERLIAAHLLEPVPRPSLQLRPGMLPPALDEVIARGMAKIPEQRYRTAGDLAAAAHDALTGADQHLEARILRQGDNAPLFANPPETPGAAPWAGTMVGPTARPVPGGGGSWPPIASLPSASSGSTPPEFARDAFRPGRKRKPWIIAGAAAVLLACAIGVTGYLGTRPSSASSKPVPGQTVVPFNGIDFRLSPGGVALDKAGDVFVTSEGMYGRVVELPAGSGTPMVLPFSGLYQPQGLAVDNAGAVYVADFNNRVIKLAAGSNAQTVLPFTGLNYPEGVAVDGAGQRLCRRPGKQPGAEVGARVERPDRAAVHRPQEPGWRGGGPRRQRLRHRHRQQQGAGAGGRVEHPECAAVHRRECALGYRGGQRRHRLRHRTRREPGDEIAGRVEHPDRAAVGRPEHPTWGDGGQRRDRVRRRPRQRPGGQAGAMIGRAVGR